MDIKVTMEPCDILLHVAKTHGSLDVSPQKSLFRRLNVFKADFTLLIATVLPDTEREASLAFSLMKRPVCR